MIYTPFILLFALACYGLYCAAQAIHTHGMLAGREQERQLTAQKLIQAKRDGANAERRRANPINDPIDLSSAVIEAQAAQPTISTE